MTNITNIKPLHSYRCYYTHYNAPRGLHKGCDVFVQVRATDADSAKRKAHCITGSPIHKTERFEPVFSEVRA